MEEFIWKQDFNWLHSLCIFVTTLMFSVYNEFFCCACVDVNVQYISDLKIDHPLLCVCAFQRARAVECFVHVWQIQYCMHYRYV
jgi:hypothetical protein